MLNATQAQEFAEHWVNAWNAHDLDAILAHYSEDFEMNSPYVSRVLGIEQDTLRGKIAVGDYWRQALSLYPNLHFKLKHVLHGARSVTLVYEGVAGLAAEVFLFNELGLVVTAHAHYE